MALSEIAYKLFGKRTRRKRYYGLQESLRKARFPTSADVYVATALLSALAAAVTGALVGLVVGLILGLGLVFLFLLTLMVSAALGSLTYFLMLQYPKLVAGERARKIDLALPYTIGFMHAMSRSGATVVDIFKELSRREDVGELQTEMKSFMRDIEYLGQDPLTALRNLSRTTPSERFRSFLDVLGSIVETGGDVTPYFASKVTEFHTLMRDENKKTVASMEFLAELYVILVQFLPLLFLAILLFMGFLPGQTVDIVILMLLAYVWVPLGSVAFMIILATVPPVELKGRPRIFRAPSPYREVPLRPGDRRDSMILRKLRGALVGVRLKRFLSNPFRIFVRNPSYVLLISAPAGLFYLFFTPIKTLTLTVCFLIIFVPYALFYEVRRAQAAHFEASLPIFLKSLSSASRSGLTLSRALRVSSTAELGALTTEIRRAGIDIEWGSSATEALAKLEQRVTISPTTARSLTLIRKASEAEENISEVVDITLNDVRTRREIMDERSTAMFVYKIIIIMSLIVFLVTVYFIVDAYMRLPTGGVVGAEEIEVPEALQVKLLFYRMLLFQSIFAGFIAGQMGGGDVRDGFKYAIALSILAVLMFELVLMPKGPPPPTPPEN
jgi:flagellar protein FlaJ